MRLIFSLVFCIVLLAALTGCASLIPNQGYDATMTANQLKAIVADKNAGVVCSQIPTPMGPAKVVIVNIDQRVIDNGGITAGADCTVTFTQQKPAPVPKEKDAK